MLWTCVDLGPQPTEQSVDRLVLKSCPRVTRAVGLTLLVISALAFLTTGKSRLTCDRPTLYAANCQITRAVGLGLIPTKTIAIESLAGTQVVSEMQESEDGDYLIYDVQLSGAYSIARLGLWQNVSDRRARAIADDIQRFLVNPAQSSLTVVTPHPWMMTAVIPAMVIGAIALLLRQAPRFEFDRATGRAQFWQTDQPWAMELWLKEIQAVAIEYWQDEDTNEGYRVVLVTQKGDRHPLTQTFSSGLESKRAAAESIRSFLGLPPLEMPEITASQR